MLAPKKQQVIYMQFINNEQRCSLFGKRSTHCSAPTIYSINIVNGSAVPKQETEETCGRQES